jgi:hypothetical protein
MSGNSAISKTVLVGLASLAAAVLAVIVILGAAFLLTHKLALGPMSAVLWYVLPTAAGIVTFRVTSRKLGGAARPR